MPEEDPPLIQYKVGTPMKPIVPPSNEGMIRGDCGEKPGGHMFEVYLKGKWYPYKKKFVKGKMRFVPEGYETMDKRCRK